MPYYPGWRARVPEHLQHLLQPGSIAPQEAPIPYLRADAKDLQNTLASTALSHEEMVEMQTLLKSISESLAGRVAHGEPEIAGPSPFRLLEGTGPDLLSLIVDNLSPPDVLCLSHVCRKMRDAAFRVFPLPPERGCRFAGPCIDETGHVCSPARLHWARSMGAMKELRYTDVCDCAAAGGYLDTLQEARKLGYRFAASTCASAASGGHLAVLEWLRSTLPPAERCPWNEGTCAAAAEGGHLDLLRWCRMR